MAKKFSLLVMVVFASCVAFGQTTKPKLEAVKYDPKTTQNAATADARLVNKRKVANLKARKTAFTKKRLLNSTQRRSLPVKSS
jgi:hypothetical protein